MFSNRSQKVWEKQPCTLLAVIDQPSCEKHIIVILDLIGWTSARRSSCKRKKTSGIKSKLYIYVCMFNINRNLGFNLRHEVQRCLYYKWKIHSGIALFRHRTKTGLRRFDGQCTSESDSLKLHNLTNHNVFWTHLATVVIFVCNPIYFGEPHDVLIGKTFRIPPEVNVLMFT